jgi:hypothetical protein
MKDKHPEYFSRLNRLKSDLRRKANTVKELESQIQTMEDFTSNSEYHFIKNLTPRLYKLDHSYKLNKPKLLRDIRMLRKCTDGKIPPVTANDSEQLRILLSKCRKNFNLDIDAPNIFTDRDSKPEMAADELTVMPINNSSPVKNTYVQSEECSSLPAEGKRKKDKKRHKKHKTKRRRRRRYSSSSSSDSNADFLDSSKRPAYFDRFTCNNYSSSFPPYRLCGTNNIAGFSYMPGYFPAPPNSATPYPMQGYLPTSQFNMPQPQAPSPIFENRDNTTYPQHGLHHDYETELPVHTCTNPRIANSITDTSTTTVNLNVNSPDKWSGLDTLVEVANDIQT